MEQRGPNVSQHHRASQHTKRSMYWQGCSERKCPAQSPNLNPTESFWNEMEYWMQPRPDHMTSASDVPKALVAELASPHSNTPKSSGKSSQTSDDYYNSKEGLNLECDVQQAHMDGRVSVDFRPYSVHTPKDMDCFPSASRRRSHI